jgi:hypothetical protein
MSEPLDDAYLDRIRARLDALPGTDVSVEEHGDGEAMYFGRDERSHGLNVVNLVEPAFQWPAVRTFLEQAPRDVSALLDEVARLAPRIPPRAKHPYLGEPAYVASRASIPERAAMWRRLRDEEGFNIVSSWIDEAGPGQTDDMKELWHRIRDEIRASKGLVLYVEPGDLPLKGAFVEAGIAFALGIPIYVVCRGIKDPRRDLGSWVHVVAGYAHSPREALTWIGAAPRRGVGIPIEEAR